jgi:hypothetical protein
MKKNYLDKTADKLVENSEKVDKLSKYNMNTSFLSSFFGKDFSEIAKTELKTKLLKLKDSIAEQKEFFLKKSKDDPRIINFNRELKQIDIYLQEVENKNIPDELNVKMNKFINDVSLKYGFI